LVKSGNAIALHFPSLKLIFLPGNHRPESHSDLDVSCSRFACHFTGLICRETQNLLPQMKNEEKLAILGARDIFCFAYTDIKIRKHANSTTVATAKTASPDSWDFRASAATGEQGCHQCCQLCSENAPFSLICLVDRGQQEQVGLNFNDVK